MEGLYHCKKDWEDYHVSCVHKIDYQMTSSPKGVASPGSFNFGNGFSYPKSPKYGPGGHGFGSKITFPPPSYPGGFGPPSSSSKPTSGSKFGFDANNKAHAMLSKTKFGFPPPTSSSGLFGAPPTSNGFGGTYGPPKKMGFNSLNSIYDDMDDMHHDPFGFGSNNY